MLTTNGFGSHIALAAYCGARVSVWGPYADFPVERMKITHAVKAFPHLLDQALEQVSPPPEIEIVRVERIARPLGAERQGSDHRVLRDER